MLPTMWWTYHQQAMPENASQADLRTDRYRAAIAATSTLGIQLANACSASSKGLRRPPISALSDMVCEFRQAICPDFSL
jgi:hypothetical protein